jgi:hypothetical protein
MDFYAPETPNQEDPEEVAPTPAATSRPQRPTPSGRMTRS